MTSRVLAVGLSLLAGFGLTIQIPDSLRPKEGQSYRHLFTAHLHMEQADVDVKGTILSTIKKSSTDQVQIGITFKDFDVQMNGSALDSNSSPETITLGAQLQPVRFEGGIEGVDNVQWYLISSFVPPAKTDLKPGDKYVIDLPKTEEGIPATHIDGVFVGMEDLNGVSTYKFTDELKQAGDGLKAKQTAWIGKDGIPAKIETDFTNMYIPVAGQAADGKATMLVQPSKTGGSL